MKLSRLALAIAVMPGLSLAAEPYVAEPLVVTSGRLAEPQARATAATTGRPFSYDFSDLEHPNPVDYGAALAATREAMTPARTSASSGRVRCSAGVR